MKHTSCAKCGSSDANYSYPNGDFCFSCRAFKPQAGEVAWAQFKALQEPVEAHEEPFLSLPDDAAFHFSQQCVDWIGKYDVTIAELIRNKVYWSESKQQLIFTFWDSDGHLLCTNARNFGSWARTKYTTKGSPDSVLSFYPGPNSQVLVLVEDGISAIKLARNANALPVLGSDASRTKLTKLSWNIKPSTQIFVWLDGNKFQNAQRLVERMQLLGMRASAVYSERDPKEFDDDEIKEFLNGNRLQRSIV